MGDDPPDKDSVTDQNIVAEDTTFCKRSCENNDSSARNPNKIQKTLFECGLWSCTFAKCTDEDNAEMLTCLKCKGKYHYRCTELPPYQIMQFISEGYTKYMCKSCIQVPDGLQKQCTIENDVVLENKSDPIKEKHDLCTQTTTTWETYERLTDKFDKLEDALHKKEEELQRVYVERNKYKHENMCLKQKIVTAEEHQVTLRKHIETKDGLLKNLKKVKENGNKGDENKILQQQILQLREQEVAMKKHLDKLQSKQNEEMSKLAESKSTNVSTDMTKLINERFDKIEKDIDQLVTQKILQHSPTAQVENLETKLDKVITNHQSYASKLSNKLEANNLASIMKETKNNDLIQEKQREMRSSNLVIYGIHEASEDETILKEQDESFISGFLGTIGVFSEPKQITRLGKLDESKRQRPMKIIMNSPKEKELVMSRLPNLQTADDIYRKCSVRDDYTYEERQLIKEWVKKAEEKNNNENRNTWKVRGTPKNGLRLVNTKRR